MASNGRLPASALAAIPGGRLEHGAAKAWKLCRACGVEKPITAFYWRPAQRCYRTPCKVCIGQYTTAHYLANREESLATGARWRTEHPERMQAARDAWAASNPGQVAAAVRRNSERRSQWRRANPAEARQHDAEQHTRHREARNAQSRQWRSAHPDDVRRYRHERRARLRGQGVEHVDRLVVLERHDGVCGICGEDVDPFRFHVDHIVPLSRGGAHSYANTQPAHALCNQRKSASLDGGL